MKNFLLVFAVLVQTILAAGLNFEFQSTLLEEKPNYRVFHVTYDSPEAPFWKEAKQVKAFYYEPKSVPQEGAPAVLCMHVLGGNGKLTQSFAAFFADNGMYALMPQMPLFLERRPGISMEKALNGPQGIQYLESTMRAIPGDIQRSMDFLASRHGVKSGSINIIGTSLGSLLAVSAFANDTRLDKAVLLLSGGDLKEILSLPNREVVPIYKALNSANGEQAKEIDRLIGLLEPLNYAEKLSQSGRNSKIMLFNAEKDTIIPPKNFQALADALKLTRGKNHFILPNADHYTASASIPDVLNASLKFFGGSTEANQTAAESADSEIIKGLFDAMQKMVATPVPNATPSRLAFRLSSSQNGKETIAADIKLVAAKESFRLELSNCKGLAGVPKFAIGQTDDIPWAISPNGTLFKGNTQQKPGMLEAIPLQFHAYRNMAHVFMKGIAATGNLASLQNLVKLDYSISKDRRTLLAHCEGREIIIRMEEKRYVPQFISVENGSSVTTLTFSEWIDSTGNIAAKEGELAPGKDVKSTKGVDSSLLVSSLKQTLSYAWGYLLAPAKQPDAICREDKQTWFEKGLRIDKKGEYPLLIFAGTPEEIGRQHGNLSKKEIQKTLGCLKLVAGHHLISKNEWFFDTIGEIQTRTANATPQRFVQEMDAMSEAAGITASQGREIGFFPELFHCSGIAAKGAATTDGQVVHVRVLDYMRDIGLQCSAQIHVFIPDGFNPWISVGFAGFNGTVTAMNAKGLAIGEMGGGGEGHWDGLPMTYLLRRIMEECDTVAQARKIIETSPLTCEYYYVISDKSGDMLTVEAWAGKTPTFLGPGDSHPKLMESFKDICWVTAPKRQKALCERIHEYYGNINAETMKKIIMRPVAMASNLHDAIFLPQSLDIHFAYADATRPGCECPYHKLNLAEILQNYTQALAAHEAAKQNQ